jgi:hypothetical protein
VPDDSVMFSYTCDSGATVSFASDLAYDDTYLYETFKFEQNKYYLAVYLRQTLDMKGYKK